MPTTAIVLAGGASRRMGTDKRFALIDGEPLLQRVLRMLPPTPDILVVIDPTRPLPPTFLDARVRPIPDIRTGAGPLAGLEAGLSAARGDTALVVAGDMPWLEPAVVELLADRLASEPGHDLACLVLDGRREPLPMACRRLPTLARATQLLDAGERRLRAILEDSRVVAIDESAWRTADPAGHSLQDIDTPADLIRAG